MDQHHRTSRLAAVAVAWTAGAAGAAVPTPFSEPAWTMTTLEMPFTGGKFGISGVNVGGTVVGFKQVMNSGTYAYVWDAAGRVSELPGVDGHPYSRAWNVGGINDAGQIAGGVEDIYRPGPPFNELKAHAVWEPDADGRYTSANVRLAPLVGDDYGTDVFWGLDAINDNGLTAHGGGRRTLGGGWGGYGGFRWQAGDPLLGDPLLGPGGATNSYFSVASLNNAGTVVGNGSAGPMLWEAGQVDAIILPTVDAPLDLQTPAAIDDDGLIVGQYKVAGDLDPRPLAWGPDGALLDLIGAGGETGDALVGTALDVDDGIAVGWQEGDDGESRAVLWLDPLAGDRAVFLDDLIPGDDWTFGIISAVAVGDGVLQLVTSGRPAGGDASTPFLLTRRTEALAPYVDPGDGSGNLGANVPEPATATLAAGVAGLALARRRRGSTVAA